MASDDGWEARMSACAKAREASRQAARAQRFHQARLALLNGPQDWLHGWPLSTDGSMVVMGTATHCAGCGVCQGVVCFVVDGKWKPPENVPNWLYSQDDCPLCEYTNEQR